MSPEAAQVLGLRASAPVELAAGVTMRPLFGSGAMLNLALRRLDQLKVGASWSTRS